MAEHRARVLRDRPLPQLGVMRRPAGLVCRVVGRRALVEGPRFHAADGQRGPLGGFLVEGVLPAARCAHASIAFLRASRRLTVGKLPRPIIRSLPLATA